MKMIIVVRYSFRKDKMITMKNINKLIGFSTVAAAIAFAAAYLYRKKQEKEEKYGKNRHGNTAPKPDST